MKQLQDYYQGEIRNDEILANHTYIRIGGPAKHLVAPETEEQLEQLAFGLKELALPFAVIGLGSNLLVSDAGFSGVVIKTNRLNSNLIENLGNNLVRVGAGVSCGAVLRRGAEWGISGLEFLAGIPGSIGGGVAMNAGTHIGDFSRVLRKIRWFSFEMNCFRDVVPETGDFYYRGNRIISPNQIVVSAEIEGAAGKPDEIKKRVQELLKKRSASQPVEVPSCGSTFKNPENDSRSAWQVIEAVGLRGFRIGNAEFSQKHCNFIINLGGATAQDVLGLIHLAKEKAKTMLGIDLHEEVRFLGF